MVSHFWGRRRLWWSWLWCFSSKFSSLSTSPSFVHPGKSLWDEDNFDEQLRDFVLQKRKETPETERGSKLDNGMVLLETQHGNNLGQGYIVSGIHSFYWILSTLGWTKALLLSRRVKFFWIFLAEEIWDLEGYVRRRSAPVQAWSWSCSQRKDLTGSWCCMLAWWSSACCWSCCSCSALKLRGCGQRSVPAWMKAGLNASGKVVDVLFSPLCVMPDRSHAGRENIFSFSLFQRSIAEGKEGEEGGGWL